MRVPRNQKGFTLLGVLMLSVFFGLVGMEIVSFYEQLQRETANIRFHGEAANLTRSVKSILSQTDLCNHAMRAGPGLHEIAWDPGDWVAAFPGSAAVSTATVERLVRPDLSVIVRIGEKFSPAAVPNTDGTVSGDPSGMYQLTDMYLRRAYSDIDGSSRLDGSVTQTNGAGVTTTYQTVSSELVMQFQFCGLNGQLCQAKPEDIAAQVLANPKRIFFVQNSGTQTVDVTVALNRNPAIGGPGNLAFCHQLVQQNYAGVDCTKIPPSAGHQCSTGAPLGCKNVPMMLGFDGLGGVICGCQTMCQSFYTGPTGTSVFNAASGALQLLIPEVTQLNSKYTPSNYKSAGPYVGYSYARYGTGSALQAPIQTPAGTK